ncbi:MAG: NADH-quinone oxidoreductase subunit C, partial [Deltaproteobacteria bacterium]|nr:NADH-quinone oxidoreductase subunit C [Deltaproteobacteria bacterium]
MEDSPNISYLRARLGGKILDSHAFRGDDTIVVARE